MQSVAENPLNEATSHAAGEGTGGQPTVGFAQTPGQTGSKVPAHRLPGGGWRRWAMGVGAAIAVLLLFVLFHSQTKFTELGPQRGELPGTASKFTPPPPKPAPMLSGLAAMKSAVAATLAVSSSAPGTPMIARTVALTIQVKDIAASRSALDAILARYQGYAAELDLKTPENAARSFGASLRIPAPALAGALAELRRLGRVQSESQNGEEVTEQHADLVARLKNARETEQRLLAILQQRTGKVSDVLEVEEQISSTRGEIEHMEAEQKALEHRVDFATVQSQLAEEFKAQLNTPSTSAGTRVSNAFVAGLASAGDSILGILLFFEEYGPVLLVWFIILGAPAWLLWRRYRSIQARI